jgi:hypothetical protein
MKSSDWSIVIFVLLLMCLFTLEDIKSEIKTQSLTETERVSLRLAEKQKKESFEVTMRAASERAKTLSFQPFSSVPAEEKMEWVKLQLDSIHPFAFLGLMTLIVGFFAFVTKRLCG